MHEDQREAKFTRIGSDNDRDVKLILRIKQRDPIALDELVELHSYTMLRLAAAVTGSQDTAQDIVQDVFMVLWTRADSLSIQGDVRGYLWAATRNHARKVLRHESVVQRHHDGSIVLPSSFDPESSSSNLAVSSLDREDTMRQVNRALEGLPPRCREIFMLNWRDELTYAEIAEALGVGVATVRNQVARAMRHIVSVLQQRK